MSKEQEAQSFTTQIDFPKLLTGANNYEDILVGVQSALQDFRERGVQQFGFVSGPVANSTETDPELRSADIRMKMRRMNLRSNELRQQCGFPLFSSEDIFSVVWNELEETHMPPEERSKKIKWLFRELLGSGVTDIFMIDGWRESEGAMDEYATAQQLNITIHDLDPREENRFPQ